jgi:hypothetical protein
MIDGSEIDCTVLLPGIESPAQLGWIMPEMRAALDGLGASYEVISAVVARSARQIDPAYESLTAEYDQLRLLSIEGEAGFAAMLQAGLAAAHGEVVAVWDASGRFDPAELPRFLTRLVRVDAVFGCRRLPRWRRIARRVAGLPRRLVLGDDLRDADPLCFAARSETVAQLDLGGVADRFLPTLITLAGYRVGELHVDARPPVWKTVRAPRRSAADLIRMRRFQRRWRRLADDELNPNSLAETAESARREPRLLRMDGEKGATAKPRGANTTETHGGLRRSA